MIPQNSSSEGPQFRIQVHGVENSQHTFDVDEISAAYKKCFSCGERKYLKGLRTNQMTIQNPLQRIAVYIEVLYTNIY